MRKAATADDASVAAPADGFFEDTIDAVLGDGADSPSRVYLGVVRAYLERRLDLSEVDMAHVVQALSHREYRVDAATGLFIGARRNASVQQALFQRDQ